MRHAYPGLCRWHVHFRQVTASITLCTFAWLLLSPTVLAAQTAPPRPSAVPSMAAGEEREWSEALEQIEAQLARLRQRLAQGEEDHVIRDELMPLRQRLHGLDTRTRQHFDRMARHLHDHRFPAEILQRHQVMVATYDAELATLLRHLDALEAARDARMRDEHATHAQQHLQKQPKQRASKRIDPRHLPFRVPDSTVRPPKETQKDFESALQTSAPVLMATAEVLLGLLVPLASLPATPTPEDLAPNEDVPITAEVRALAASLGHHPVTIFNWVHDQIAFLPTYGSIQGASLTLQTKRGNAFDTASLLIALLRAGQIHARYVLGTVQIPIDRVMNWVGGVQHPEAALQVLGQGGIPHVAVVQGGVVTAVKLEHVWVEAWVDFEPSRGAIHRQGDTWIPLDASFKQYQYTPGMDLQNQVPFDARAFITQVTASTQSSPTEGWIRILNSTGI